MGGQRGWVIGGRRRGIPWRHAHPMHLGVNIAAALKNAALKNAALKNAVLKNAGLKTNVTAINNDGVQATSAQGPLTSGSPATMAFRSGRLARGATTPTAARRHVCAGRYW